MRFGNSGCRAKCGESYIKLFLSTIKGGSALNGAINQHSGWNRLFWARCQKCLCDVSCSSLRWRVNQISQTEGPSWLAQQRSCFESSTDNASSICFPWHKLAAKGFAGCTLIFIYLKGLFSAVVGKHLRVVGGALNPELRSRSLLCVSYVVPRTFTVICIVGFTCSWFRALKEKTNKNMSSASFITSQPVISASALVSLRWCRLICLSLSKTRLCGP